MKLNQSEWLVLINPPKLKISLDFTFMEQKLTFVNNNHAFVNITYLA